MSSRFIGRQVGDRPTLGNDPSAGFAGRGRAETDAARAAFGESLDPIALLSLGFYRKDRLARLLDQLSALPDERSAAEAILASWNEPGVVVKALQTGVIIV